MNPAGELALERLMEGKSTHFSSDSFYYLSFQKEALLIIAEYVFL